MQTKTKLVFNNWLNNDVNHRVRYLPLTTLRYCQTPLLACLGCASLHLSSKILSWRLCHIHWPTRCDGCTGVWSGGQGGGGGGQWGQWYVCAPTPPPHFYFSLELYVYITLTINYLASFIYQLIILWKISINWHRWLFRKYHISSYITFILVPKVHKCMCL